MIDPTTETLITAREAARHAAFRRRGRPPHSSTVWRWFSSGAMGRSGHRVRLESIKVPGGTFTSEEAIARFIVALNDGDAAPSPITPQAKDTDRALEELRAAGIE